VILQPANSFVSVDHVPEKLFKTHVALGFVIIVVISLIAVAIYKAAADILSPKENYNDIENLKILLIPKQ
jgi:hypothetical protein